MCLLNSAECSVEPASPVDDFPQARRLSFAKVHRLIVPQTESDQQRKRAVIDESAVPCDGATCI
jgi:hypothetical protein